MRRTSGLVVALALCAVAVPLAAARRADSGGPDIASAPELPLGHQVTGSGAKDAHGNYQEYWAVTSVNGDVLDLIVSSTSAAGVVVCLYTPAVTDTNLPGAECRQTETIAGQGLQTFRFQLDTPGRWTLAFHGSVLSQPFSYAATGRVEHPQLVTKTATTTVLKVKRQARRRTAVTLIGSVSEGSTGRVRIQARPVARTRWTTLAALPLTATSRFSFTTRFLIVGSYVVRAAYGGDARHLPSAATARIRIY